MSPTQRPRGSRRTIEAAQALAQNFELPFVALDESGIQDDAFFALPATLTQRGTLLPYRIEEGRLKIAVADECGTAST